MTTLRNSVVSSDKTLCIFLSLVVVEESKTEAEGGKNLQFNDHLNLMPEIAEMTSLITVCAPILLFVLATFHMEHLQHPCQMKDHRKVDSNRTQHLH